MSDQATKNPPPPKARLVRPPRHIRQRVGASGGPDLKDAVAQATKAIEPFSKNFLEQIRGDIARLNTILRVIEHRAEEIGRHRSSLFAIAHELRGQAGTFGYPLATAVADTFYKYLDHRDSLEPEDAKLVTLQIHALLAVFREDIQGSGGAIGDELRALLEKLIARLGSDVGRRR
ncbi:MAG: hypothetical protein FJX47_16985 [Alphaproteobacteria bacterium]|nr:hypothetical protein [Alphaproteobacteria bacterium]